ncbi:hypothetical protein [Dactylosporangium sp. CA-139066]|uniref:hypothetical protein n=1 Tax=Dactylosporangium sp. CA-139066 TaxID=3239930 RepID=UPI003D8D54A4
MATLLALTACGSRPSSADDQGQEAAPAATSGTPAAPVQTQAAARPATDLIVRYSASDGSKVTVKFALQSAVKASDPSVAGYFSKGVPCSADGQRDAVFVGTLTITNEVSGFDARVDLAMGTYNQTLGGDATLTFGAAYGNGNQCSNLNGSNAYGAMQPAVAVHFSGQQWGPVRVEFVVSDVYTPAQPAGNTSVIAANAPVLTAFVGSPTNLVQYQADSVTGPVTNMGGALGQITLNLGQIAS